MDKFKSKLTTAEEIRTKEITQYIKETKKWKYDRDNMRIKLGGLIYFQLAASENIKETSTEAIFVEEIMSGVLQNQ